MRNYYTKNRGLTYNNYSQVIFPDNHADISGGAIFSSQNDTISLAGSVQFINNSAYHGGAICSYGDVTISDNAQIVFQGNDADSLGGAILIASNIVLAGSVQFISNTAQLGGAISMFPGQMTVANNAQVIFQGNNAYHVGGAIYSSYNTLVYSVVVSDTCIVSFGVNSTMELLHNTAERGGSAMYGITMSKLICDSLSGDYEYLYDVITIIPDSFSAVSSDALRVCICPDQSTPDCLDVVDSNRVAHPSFYMLGETLTNYRSLSFTN